MAADEKVLDHCVWQVAIDFGIDVTLLQANLRRTPAERIRELTAMNRFHAEVQARVVPETLRRRLEERRLVEKFGELLRHAPWGDELLRRSK